MIAAFSVGPAEWAVAQFRVDGGETEFPLIDEWTLIVQCVQGQIYAGQLFIQGRGQRICRILVGLSEKRRGTQHQHEPKTERDQR
jgi:hypothetical protein